MATVLFLVIFVLLMNISISLEFCQDSCDSTIKLIRFPFGLDNNNSSNRCSYPGFDLSCDGENQTILTLPRSGTFIVNFIDYETQEIRIQDPALCLARRFLDNFSLSGSPFVGQYHRSFTFLNCSVVDISTPLPLPSRRVNCLSDNNFTVVAVPSEYEADVQNISGCRVRANRVQVPVFWHRMAEGQTALFWLKPDCRDCEQSGGTCEFKDDNSLDIGCPSQSNNGRRLPRSAKYGIIIGVGIPGLLCIIGLGCYLCGKLRTYSRSHHSTADLPTSFGRPPTMSATGLDKPTIELYPKTLLGESRRLPKPNDSTCPICLCEYQPKETLRTIPECNHYFHADCIDEWLKMNATCPLCRNSPDVSSIATTSPLSSSSSLATPSSSLSASSFSMSSGR